MLTGHFGQQRFLPERAQQFVLGCIPEHRVPDGLALKRQVIDSGEHAMGEIVDAYVTLIPTFRRWRQAGISLWAR